MGPARASGPETRRLVAAALTRPGDRRTVVLDADALTSFAGEAATLAGLIARGGHAAVMTPHEGEFARCSPAPAGIGADDDKLDPRPRGGPAHGRRGPVKGADTVVAAPDGRATIGWDLPPWLATAGSGDVLSGLVAGLAAQEAPGVRSRVRRGLAARRLRPGGRSRPDRRGPAGGSAGGLKGARIAA